MREIKFRMWDTNTNYWFEALSVHIHASGKLLHIPENVILMQYTGLKDKHGKEIYECDIVKGVIDTLTPSLDDIDAYYIVKYEDGTWNYSYSLIEVGQNPSKDWEVIGNIYEHPRLLTKGESENEQ